MQTLKQIRESIPYSIREMAQALGLSASTYQCYDNGSRPTPQHVLDSAKTELIRCQEWSKRYVQGGVLDELMKDVKPFMSEVGE